MARRRRSSPPIFGLATGTTNVCTDTPLHITFNAPPVMNNSGAIRIYTSTGTLVDTIDLTLSVTNPANLAGSATYAFNVQPRTIGGTTYTNFPVIISDNTAFIYPHLDLLTSNQTYYVNVDAGIFSNGVSTAAVLRASRTRPPGVSLPRPGCPRPAAPTWWWRQMVPAIFAPCRACWIFYPAVPLRAADHQSARRRLSGNHLYQ